MASCPGDKSVTNEDTNTINLRAQYENNLTQFDKTYIKNFRCRQSKGYYPSYVPVIYNLSTTTSLHGTYSLVYITGDRFQPECSGKTYVNFISSTHSYTKLPITFFSSTYISFVVPIDAPAGTYSVHAVNVYNGNFSPQVNNSYPGILDYSNGVDYILT
jgi:hypothetical protein